jgi:hypothetical protein
MSRASLEAVNARRPDTISYSTQPNAQISVRGERGLRGFDPVAAGNWPGKAEIQELRLRRSGRTRGCPGEHDVPGLQVAMNDAGPMRGVESVSNLGRDGQDLRVGQRSPCDPGGERVAVEQFHDQERDAEPGPGVSGIGGILHKAAGRGSVAIGARPRASEGRDAGVPPLTAAAADERREAGCRVTIESAARG